MNETGFDPTFANEEQTFDDLNKAHDLDAKNGGNREEGVYPALNVHVDNARAYGEEVTNAQSTEELTVATRALDEKNPETNVSEFDERTGQHQEATDVFRQRIEQQGAKIEAWEIRKETELSYVRNSQSITELNGNLNDARVTASVGLLGEAQLKEIIAAGEARKVDLWEIRKETELSYVRNSRSITELNGNLNDARAAASVGVLGEVQLNEIIAAGEARKVDLWEIRKETELSYVRNSRSITELNGNLNDARAAASVGVLGEVQLNEIIAAGEARKVDLWEIRKETELSYVRNSRSITELNGNLNDARVAASVGLLGEAQLKEIIVAGESKGEALQVAAAILG